MGHQLSQTFLIQYHSASSGSIARQFAVTLCAENPFSEYTDCCETTIDTRKRIHLGFALQLISLHRRQKIIKQKEKLSQIQKPYLPKPA